MNVYIIPHPVNRNHVFLAHSRFTVYTHIMLILYTLEHLLQTFQTSFFVKFNSFLPPTDPLQ
jgi:hypothetical protein